MLNFQVERLKRLPQRGDETWQGGLIRTGWVDDPDREPYRPWAPLWVSLRTKMVSLPQLLEPHEDRYAKALEALVTFAENRKFTGYRPGRVEVSDSELAGYLSDPLAAANIEVICRDTLPDFDGLMGDLLREMGSDADGPGALSGAGVTVERMRAFAEAAAAFMEAEPWRYLTDEDLVRIEAPDAPAKGLQLVTVMGAGGQTYGLGFFESEKQYRRLFESDNASNFFAKSSVWSVTFDTIMDLPSGDADLWEDHDFPVADDEAFPLAARFDPNKTMVRPDAPTLAYLEGLLRAFAQSSESEMDTGRWSKTAETFDGPVEYTLTLPELLAAAAGTGKRKKSAGVLSNPLKLDRMMEDMRRVLEGQEFESPEAATQFLNEQLAAGTPAPAREARTALEEAQDLVEEAADARGRRRIQLARKALEVSPDCTDAYVLLSQETSDVDKACELLRQGVAAAERMLGKAIFKEQSGHFWDILETRPYMRARLELAQCLEEMEQTDEALDHYRDLLRLNPDDNQGVRYILLSRLIEAGRDEEARNLIKRYPDESMATWLYGRALLTFRHEGDAPAAREHLRAAVKANKHVPKYLLEKEPMPQYLPDFYGVGDNDEAIVCADELIDVWADTPGARAWLAVLIKARRKKK